MKILFVTSEIPNPPDNGVRIVSHHAMRLMAEAGHDPALAVLSADTTDSKQHMELPRQWCGDGLAELHQLSPRSKQSIAAASFLKRRLYFLERYRDERFRSHLKGLVKRFRPDVVHFDLILMTQYRDCVPPGIGTVASINDSYALTLDNALSAGQYTGIHRRYRSLQRMQTRRYEAEAYARFNFVHTMTEVDALYLKKLNPSIETRAIPNGVDPGLFHITDQTRGNHDVIYVAKMVGDNVHNLNRFLEQGWSIVQKESPGAQLHVVGGFEPGAAETSHALAKRIGGVQFHGYVENLADAYARCGIAVVPINKDCGIINKAIEAMAGGLAVVGFEKTFAGIPEVTPGRHALAADSFAGIGRSIGTLVHDEVMLVAVQREAADMARRSYTWASRQSAYEQMYADAHERSAIQ